MNGPLDGIRVLENANFISGPYAGMLLADLGAEVVKVERPDGGDPFRRWTVGGGELIPMFAAFNRGKKSVTLDLKDDADRSAYLELAEGVDVIVENFRPGTLDDLGIGHDAVRVTNPGIVYCSISGLGSSGPFVRKPTYDSIGQALSGLWSQFTDLRAPEPLGPALSDQICGLFAAYGVLGALVERTATGVGQQLEVSMLGASLGFMAVPIAELTMAGEVSGPWSRPHRSQSYAFTGSDGKPFGIHLSSPEKFWRALVTVVGLPGLLEDQRFLTAPDRVEHYDELRAILAGVFATDTREAWLERLAERDVPAAAIYDIQEALASPEAQPVDMVAEFGDGERQVRLAGFPVRYRRTPSRPGLPPPLLGEHTEEIVAEARRTKLSSQTER